MNSGRGTTQSAQARRTQLAGAVAARPRELGVLVFALRSGLPQLQVVEHLAEQFAQLQLDTRVVSAGPERVQSVLEGKFAGIDVLVALGPGGQDTEDELMDLVQWLLANGRAALAENLIFAQLHHESRHTPAPVFNRVLLDRGFVSETQRGGRRFPWAAAHRRSWALADAVLDYAAGLDAE